MDFDINFVRGLVLILLIIGFLAIVLAYKQVLAVEQQSALRVERANVFGDLVNRASISKPDSM